MAQTAHSPDGQPVLLKNSFNVGDEVLVARWSETIVWQFFGGVDY